MAPGTQRSDCSLKRVGISFFLVSFVFGPFFFEKFHKDKNPGPELCWKKKWEQHSKMAAKKNQKKTIQALNLKRTITVYKKISKEFIENFENLNRRI